MQLSPEILALRDEVRENRRHLHQYPETGFKEHKTQEFILEKLRSYGFADVAPIAKTGVRAVLRAKNPKKTLAFRADIDALPILEENDVPFASKHKGFMHACGHDGHTSTLLGFARYAKTVESTLEDNLVFLFQPAEEGEGGADVIINEGGLDGPKVDYIFGYHLYPLIPEGKIGFVPGAMMAAVADFDLTLRGKGGHGAMPHLADDLIVAGAALVQGAQSIVSRTVNPFENAVVTFGTMHAGTKRNILADSLRFEGTIRVNKQSAYATIKERFLNMVEHYAKAYGIAYELDLREGYPALDNDPFLAEVLRKQLGNDFTYVEPIMGGEDFACYQRRVPGLFMFLGIRNEEKGYVHGLHNPRFNFDEGALLYGIQAYRNLIEGRPFAQVGGA